LATELGAAEGALAEDLGGLASSHFALMPLALPPELPDPLLLLLPPLEPQAVKARMATEPTAARDKVELRIVAPFPGATADARRAA
jgi:hypothetical protein